MKSSLLCSPSIPLTSKPNSDWSVPLLLVLPYCQCYLFPSWLVLLDQTTVINKPTPLIMVLERWTGSGFHGDIQYICCSWRVYFLRTALFNRVNYKQRNLHIFHIFLNISKILDFQHSRQYGTGTNIWVNLVLVTALSFSIGRFNKILTKLKPC